MNGPVHIDLVRLADFIDASGPVVLFLSAHPAHRFNRSLCEFFGNEEGRAVTFGQVSLAALLRSPSPALAFLHARVQASGAPSLLALPPGYYLFRRGRMLAWHLGLPMPADAKRLLGASMLGAGLAMLARNLRFLGMVLSAAADDAAAARIASRFHEAATQGADRPQVPPEVAQDELLEAYHVLGVDVTASDAELTRAWRAMQHRYHPDRAGPDQGEFERLSRRCVEINRARDIIRKHRRSHAARQ